MFYVCLALQIEMLHLCRYNTDHPPPGDMACFLTSLIYAPRLFDASFDVSAFFALLF